jgi:SAM-dependent methyltransferase
MIERIQRVGLLVARCCNALAPWSYRAFESLVGFRILRGAIGYVRDFAAFRRLAGGSQPSVLDCWPFLLDRFEPAGLLLKHYFIQDLWASRKVYQSGVGTHYDFGSRVDGFVAHCLAFCEVRAFDIRPYPVTAEGLTAIEADVTNLREIASDSLDSLSSLHALEHIGLGRYGDVVNPQGHELALLELERVLKPGGHLYLGIPIGRARLEFNAHRILAPAWSIETLRHCDLVEFSVIDDDERFIRNARPLDYTEARYSCGLYHFRKKKAPENSRS